MADLAAHYAQALWEALCAESVLVVPLSVKAQMARDGIAPNQLQTWWSPDTERRVDPFDDPEVRAAIRHLLSDIWHAPVRHSDGSQEGRTDG